MTLLVVGDRRVEGGPVPLPRDVDPEHRRVPGNYAKRIQCCKRVHQLLCLMYFFKEHLDDKAPKSDLWR